MLLEALISLATLATAGAAITALMAQSLDGVHRAREARDEMTLVSAFLGNVTLWSRDDLLRHVGTTQEGRWRLTISKSTGDLYSVAISDSSGSRVLLTSALYLSR